MIITSRFARAAAVRIALCAALAASAACAGTLRPQLRAFNSNEDALLVLPGFGYGRAGEHALRALAPAMSREGIDLYVPDYLTRSGLASSRGRLERFIRENNLLRYRRLHVFAFIAGAWTINPLIEQGKLPNLAGVVYDRSPLQERAPAVAVDRLRLLAWLRYGSTIFDVARTRYQPVESPGVRMGLLVETRPTSFIRHHEEAARSYGPFEFACATFQQEHDDCGYVALAHDELYTRFGDIWPDVLAFIRTGRFSTAMNRTPLAGDPLSARSAQ